VKSIMEGGILIMIRSSDNEGIIIIKVLASVRSQLTPFGSPTTIWMPAKPSCSSRQEEQRPWP
jgi:hypothetical protein